MALREIVKFPDARLKNASKRIGEVTDAHRELASDMCEVMYDEPGIGLAAPQVGESIRLIVIDTEWTEQDAEPDPLVVINPEILEPEGKSGMPTTVLSEGAFMNVDGVEFVTGQELKTTVFHTSFCSLYFNPNRGPGSNLVQVTKMAEGTWTVEPQAPPNNVAFCADGERGYQMTFKITVTLK